QKLTQEDENSFLTHHPNDCKSSITHHPSPITIFKEDNDFIHGYCIKMHLQPDKVSLDDQVLNIDR
ncbi:MAG: hypothetical protein JXB07_20225, partial [Anaerolineae bacterium]|nr:hypothetical protein [Anaerolineae bacterium]